MSTFYHINLYHVVIDRNIERFYRTVREKKKNSMCTRRKNMCFCLSLSLFYLLLQATMTLFKAIYIYIFAIFFLSFFFFPFLYLLLFFFFGRCYCCRRYFVWNTGHAWMRCKMHSMAEETDRPFNAYVNSCKRVSPFFASSRDCLSINHISLVMAP